AHFQLVLAAGGQAVVRLRLTAEADASRTPFDGTFAETFAARRAEADAFQASLVAPGATDAECEVARQASAGLLWTKQFYAYGVAAWPDGAPGQPPPPASRKTGRNAEWRHLYNRDIISVPDTWEYPWYAAWDLAFHTIVFARADPHFAKEQLVLFL